MPLVGVVNNAGIALGGPLEVIPLDDLRRQLETNVIGPIAVRRPCCRWFAPRRAAWCW